MLLLTTCFIFKPYLTCTQCGYSKCYKVKPDIQIQVCTFSKELQPKFNNGLP